MHAAFPSRNVRPFTHALSCLLRFSDRLNVQCMRDLENDSLKLRLSAINSTQSGFCAFEFYDYFFEVLRTDLDQKIDCETGIRPILSVLRTGNNKTLDRCEISIFDHEDESRIAVRLHSKGGIVKTHKLTYAAVPGLWPNVPPNAPCQLSIGPKVVHDFLDHFGNKNGGEVTFWCGPRFFMVRSRADDTLDKNQFRRAIATQVTVQLDAFEAFTMVKEVCLTFPLKEFKAAIAASEHLGVNLELSFGEGGEPLRIRCQLEALHADFVIATTPGEVPSDAASAAQARRAQSGPSSAANPAAEAASRAIDSSRPQGSSRRPTLQNGESQPNASAMDSARPPRMQESTPRVGVALARHNTDIPLFRGSQGSDGQALREDRGSEEAGGRDEEDLAALEEVEQSVQRGDIRLRSSQAPSAVEHRADAGPRAQASPHHVEKEQGSPSSHVPQSAQDETPPSVKLYTSSNISVGNKINSSSSVNGREVPRALANARSQSLRHVHLPSSGHEERDESIRPPGSVGTGHFASQPVAATNRGRSNLNSSARTGMQRSGARLPAAKSWQDALENASQMVLDDDEGTQADENAARQRALEGTDTHTQPPDEDELGASDEDVQKSTGPRFEPLF
ncbi:hypothetical protein IE81DRAFT_326242 [Ceraceosorus guamensis]|uniref:Rad9-domain-containing protein n=1 Tax=Ceraceosorus guamensis TaxID=1522189 RepID=A0A316VQC2_9BASI|nr:hypothetical protein IE81DRAFT_326242 [Ceraceosorus guamensis]PWN39722.1 hypothetical protein IE81DRAFT_326242 [Ceraceosorus guamensis]